MTELLKKAFEKASKLPPKEQDAFAAMVLAELESETRWDQIFEQTQDDLATLAGEAVADLKAGRTKALDADEL